MTEPLRATTTDTQPTLRADELSVWRNDLLIIDACSFVLTPGNAILVSGANGAGKSTLLRVLTGLRHADEGVVAWRDTAIDDLGSDYTSQLTFIGHSDGLQDALTGFENLSFAARIRGIGGTVLHTGIARACDELQLHRFVHNPVRHLSAGQRRRVALARLLIEGAPLWLLDEPLTAIDADGRAQIEQLIDEHLNHGGMCVFTSHQAISLQPLAARTTTLTLAQSGARQADGRGMGSGL